MGKYVLITGGTKGIGKAVAFCLGKAGYNLILTYASGTDVANQVVLNLQQQLDVQVEALQADISAKESIEKIFIFLNERSLRLDAVVFNAGLTCRDSFETLEMDEWERIFFANVHFPVFLMQRLISLMNKGGSIVFTGSLMGFTWHSSKESTCQCRRHRRLGFNLWVGKIP